MTIAAIAEAIMQRCRSPGGVVYGDSNSNGTVANQSLFQYDMNLIDSGKGENPTCWSSYLFGMLEDFLLDTYAQVRYFLSEKYILKLQIEHSESAFFSK
jgi:hypothetical protein